MELPAIDLVFQQPQGLLGEAVHARFGTEFPIRFDFLDTMEGGNLSLQVHPLTEYIYDKFGMNYTQDESYYLLDAGADACVYLGFKAGIDRKQMLRELKSAKAGGVVSRGKICEPLAGWKARSFSDSGGNHPLLGREQHGAGNQRDSVYLYVQAVGLGPTWA